MLMFIMLTLGIYMLTLGTKHLKKRIKINFYAFIYISYLKYRHKYR